MVKMNKGRDIMRKIWVVLLIVLLIFLSVGTALSESNTPVNKNIQRETLNKIFIPKGASSFTFTADIMGTGTEQIIKISKDKYGDYNIRVLQQNEILTSLNFIGSTKKDTILRNEQWYLAYLRNNHTPDLVYFFIDGSGAFLNDFKIFGITQKNEINKLFDAKPYHIPEKIGSQTNLSIKGTHLILTGQKGEFTLDLNNDHLKSEHN